MKKKTKILKSTDVLNIINESLEKDKALEINTIDLINRSSIADHMIIASGSSSRHVASMSNNLIKKLKDCGIKAKKPEGLINSDSFFNNETFEIKAIGYDYENYFFTIGEPDNIAESKSYEGLD